MLQLHWVLLGSLIQNASLQLCSDFVLPLLYSCVLSFSTSRDNERHSATFQTCCTILLRVFLFTFCSPFSFLSTFIFFLPKSPSSSSLPVALGRNQPLKRERPKWKSDYPMTEGQLRSKRDEFWDTAPAFEGRKEIWDALRAAASAFESNDHLLAQAILDGASITLPHGNKQFPFMLRHCFSCTASPQSAQKHWMELDLSCFDRSEGLRVIVCRMLEDLCGQL